LAIAVINPKSVGGYLAAFSQFVQPDVPIWDQMGLIMPTALTLTALSYMGFTAIGAGLGRAAMGVVFGFAAQWARALSSMACFWARPAHQGEVDADRKLQLQRRDLYRQRWRSKRISLSLHAVSQTIRPPLGLWVWRHGEL
jgi:hypothetical protein